MGAQLQPSTMPLCTSCATAARRPTPWLAGATDATLPDSGSSNSPRLVLRYRKPGCYLKALHSANMSWEVIYWHAWAACEVVRSDSHCVSLLETDRYILSDEAQSIKIKNMWVVLCGVC